MAVGASALSAPIGGEACDIRDLPARKATRRKLAKRSLVAIGGAWDACIDLARASLIGTAPIAPLIAAVLALSTHVSGSMGGLVAPSFGAAVVSLGLAWGALAVLFAAFGLTQARRANLSSYCELSDLLIELRGNYSASLETGPQTAVNTSAAAARTQFAAYSHALQQGLYGTNWSRAVWVLQMGYVSAWQLVHRAQEALIALEDPMCVALRAKYDQLRLTGARLDGKDHLIEQLKNALVEVEQSSGASNDTKCRLRLVVATVRRTLNEYVDENRAALVRARMHLMCTTMCCGLIGYAVLWLAMAAGANDAQLEMAAVFFTVGALIGLVGRLQSEIGNDTAVEDFGLSGARLLAAPQLSGLAAVLGVGLLALMGMTGRSEAPLTNAFAMSANPVNIVTAAVFGLTPGLLIDRLKQQTDGLKQNLRSAEPQATHVR